MKKCPPGIICIENVTMFFILLIIISISYYLFTQMKNQSQTSDKQYNREVINVYERNGGSYGNNIMVKPRYSYSNTPNDVLMNPYAPPLSDERYIIPELSMAPPGRVPINIPTNVGAVDTPYRQVGILTPLNSKGNMLPLMGRPLFVSRDKWQYYTMSDQSNSIKLPISVKGKSASNEYGVDKVYNGDSVYVEGYNQPFKATIYDNDTIRYLPFL